MQRVIRGATLGIGTRKLTLQLRPSSWPLRPLNISPETPLRPYSSVDSEELDKKPDIRSQASEREVAKPAKRMQETVDTE